MTLREGLLAAPQDLTPKEKILSFIHWNPFLSCLIVIAFIFLVIIFINRTYRNEVKRKMKNFNITKNTIIYVYCFMIIAICIKVPYQFTAKVPNNYVPANKYAGYHLIYEPPDPDNNKMLTEILYGRIVLELISATAIAGILYTYVKGKENN